jgi:hypothetical protein
LTGPELGAQNFAVLVLSYQDLHERGSGSGSRFTRWLASEDYRGPFIPELFAAERARVPAVRDDPRPTVGLLRHATAASAVDLDVDDA